jgi:hypothetical protein
MVAACAALALCSCATRPATAGAQVAIPFGSPVDGVSVAKFDLPVGPAIAVSDSGLKKLFPGGLNFAAGSGLAFDRVDADGSLVFLGITDRGPNVDSPAVVTAEGKSASKIFAAPDFTPSLISIRVNAKGVSFGKAVELKDSKGVKISGLPVPPKTVGSSDEVPLSPGLATFATDVDGLDTESIAFDAKSGDYVWISDEYGPFVVKVEAATGKIVTKLAPGTGLPSIIAKRIPNRGAEGLAVTPNGNVYVAVQSILDVVPGGSGKSKAPFTRIVEYNPSTGATRQFAYPIDSGYKKNADAKIGDLVAIDDTHFLIIEQGKRADGIMRNLVYCVDISKATDITAAKTANGAEPESVANLDELKSLGVVPASKALLVDLRKYGWSVEKAEGLAIVDGHTIAVASDNDFGLAVSVVNPENGKTDIGDYTVENGTLCLDGKPTSAILSAVPNGEAGKFWLFRFDTGL